MVIVRNWICAVLRSAIFAVAFLLAASATGISQSAALFQPSQSPLPASTASSSPIAVA